MDKLLAVILDSMDLILLDILLNISMIAVLSVDAGVG